MGGGRGRGRGGSRGRDGGSFAPLPRPPAGEATGQTNRRAPHPRGKRKRVLTLFGAVSFRFAFGLLRFASARFASLRVALLPFALLSFVLFCSPRRALASCSRVFAFCLALVFLVLCVLSCVSALCFALFCLVSRRSLFLWFSAVCFACLRRFASACRALLCLLRFDILSFLLFCVFLLLCCVVLRVAFFCSDLLCAALLRFALVCSDLSCFDLCPFDLLCAVFCFVLFCFASLCFALLRFASLCFALLRFVLSWFVLSWSFFLFCAVLVRCLLLSGLCLVCAWFVLVRFGVFRVASLFALPCCS